MRFAELYFPLACHEYSDRMPLPRIPDKKKKATLILCSASPIVVVVESFLGKFFELYLHLFEFYSCSPVLLSILFCLNVMLTSFGIDPVFISSVVLCDENLWPLEYLTNNNESIRE